ncbi:Acyl-CoA dehydrogenase [Azotobacter vinelandii CA]|uniref:Acyl-CoA dehydrogenase n=2 Tax=Azotobacter vinelandii TaxID=354 RepID=C1DFU0_AZOVD|nr:SfnB family sulfur acquisition oxidoreductase [Azotobacter vinelandii]ACO80486.1 Acyl-CoA dehydrogenase [Azotobacter vinelandii DJ]AGK14387.1 Acyl-CoA dehydrogenase [Azotobacter vinelandii CA]AGK21944.1 Acyl-CoA dehydrogenase [Azotobacter vinelandii CA6]SFX35435.1 sulfur acquisition oxidoreductase, SfnB family [Azotobacter vinelandii]GLK58534.1 SfnB family sulfur acquisition oxidoreductase [Azotobacter vinelandii]
MSEPQAPARPADPYLQALPQQPAHRIRSDAEAIEIARALAADFAREAAQRDRERRLPVAELNAFSQSGLWGITVPRSHGGAEVSYRTLGEVIKTVAAADPSLAQLPQNHLAIVDHIRLDGSEEQKRYFFGLVLDGVRFGNAFSERNSRTVADFETRLSPDGEGFFRVDGQKFYSSGALLAHWVPTVAVDSEKRAFLAFIRRDAEGLEVINDWSGFGQRTTASGTVLVNKVRVPAGHLLPVHQAFERPTAAGPISQFLQAAIDAGIARGALAETQEQVRRHARPWLDSGLEHAWQDPYTLQQIGDLQIRQRAAEAVLDLAADSIQLAVANPDEDTVAAASIAVAEAKVLTTEAAILASNKLFELAGTRSTLEEYNLDRHWRNARTHTLHDPVRWKFSIIGDYYLNGVKPARHPWL